MGTKNPLSKFLRNQVPISSLLLTLFLNHQAECAVLGGLSSYSLTSWWSTLADTAFKKERNLQCGLRKDHRTRRMTHGKALLRPCLHS